MATFPTNNRAYPAYGASYPATYAASAYSTSPASPAAPATDYYRAANPMTGNPAQVQPWASPMAVSTTPTGVPNRIFPSLPQPHFPSLSSMFGPAQPQQPMVISVNSPKMTREEIKKSFLLKVAASTISFVAGLGIIGFVALKILPQRISNELYAQFHRSLINNLDKASLKELFVDIQTNRNSEVSQALYEKWGRKDATLLFKNKNELKQFKRDIVPYASPVEIGGKVLQQISRIAFTPKFLNEQFTAVSHNIGEEGLSDTSKKALIDKLCREAKGAKEEFIKAGYDGNKKLSELTKNQQTEIFKVVKKYATNNDILGSGMAEIVQTSLQEGLKGSWILSWFRPAATK